MTNLEDAMSFMREHTRAAIPERDEWPTDDADAACAAALGASIWSLLRSGATVHAEWHEWTASPSFAIGYRGCVRIGQPFQSPLDALRSALTASEK